MSAANPTKSAALQPETVPPARVDSQTALSLGGFTGVLLLALMLGFAPFNLGSNRPLPLLFLELGAVVLILHCLWWPAYRTYINKGSLILLMALIALPMLQLIPVPYSLWEKFPGHGYLAQALSLSGADIGGWRAISIAPYATEAAWLAMLPPIAVFLVAIGLVLTHVRTLIVLFLALAAFESVLALGQFIEYYIDFSVRKTSPVTGTFANSNHLAGMLLMALPVNLALFTATLGRPTETKHYRHIIHGFIAKPLVPYVHRSSLYGIAALLMIFALAATLTENAILLLMLALLLSALAFAGRLGVVNSYGASGTLSIVVIVVILEVCLALLFVYGIETDTAFKEQNTAISSAAWRAVMDYLPFGSGAGTFALAFAKYQPTTISGLVNHAGNDYQEWLLTNGILIAVIWLFLMAIYLRQWLWLWQRSAWSTVRSIQFGAGISILLMLLYSFADFNLRIPANALFFALLVAIFLQRPKEKGLHRTKRRRRISRLPSG